MVKIRLTRMGAHKRPFYRVIVADSRARRDGPFIEIVGTYNPMTKPSEVSIKLDRVQYWLEHGAQPTERAAKLIEKAKQQPAA